MARFLGTTVLSFALSCAASADERDQLKVGVQPDGRIVVPTNQILQPAGKQITFPGRPVDLILIDDGKTLVAKNMRNLVFIDVATATIKQTLALPAAAKGLSAAFSAAGLIELDSRIYATDSQNAIRIATRNDKGAYAWDGHFMLKAPQVGGAAYPTGMGVYGKMIWVASSRGNEVQFIDPTTGEVKERVPVGVAPYMPVVNLDRMYVSNWGGEKPKDSPLTSSKTPVKVDPKTHVANHGSVSVIQETAVDWKPRSTIPVGDHPSGIVASPKEQFIYVANANSDSISVISTLKDEVVETIDCKPDGKLPFGSGSNALALSKDGTTLFVANGTGNCIAVVKLGFNSREDAKGLKLPSAVVGLIPTGWYPGAIRLSADGKKMFVANVKGHGSLQPRKVDPRAKKDGKGDGDDPADPQKSGRNSHDHLGSVSIIDLPDADALKKYTVATHLFAPPPRNGGISCRASRSEFEP